MGEGGSEKNHRTNFYPVTSKKVGIRLKFFDLLILTLLHTKSRFQGHT